MAGGEGEGERRGGERGRGRASRPLLAWPTGFVVVLHHHHFVAAAPGRGVEVQPARGSKSKANRKSGKRDMGRDSRSFKT